MARKPKIQTRVERDTKDAIDAFNEDHADLSQSEAVRHLIRAGLAEKGYPVAAADGGDRDLLETIAAPRTIGVGTAFMLLGGVFMLLGAWFAQGGMMWPALISVLLMGISMTLAAIITTLAALAQLALARPLKGLVGLGMGEKA